MTALVILFALAGLVLIFRARSAQMVATRKNLKFLGAGMMAIALLFALIDAART